MSPGKLRSQIRWSFGGLYSSHGKRLMLMENALRVPKPEVFLKQPNLLICCEMRSGDSRCSIKLPEWRCQGHGTRRHFSGTWVALGVAIIAHKRKLKISFPQLSGHAKRTEASGSITVSEPDAR